MRNVTGWIVLVLGILGLSYWGAQTYAKRIQVNILGAAQNAVQSTVHDVGVTVSGRDVTATGLADSADERQSILESLDKIPGRRVVRDKLTVLERARPFVTEGAKTGQGQQIGGHVPTEALRALLVRRDMMGAKSMTLAAGAPEGWNGAVDSASAALAPLEFGAWSLSDMVLRFTGEARTPVEQNAALEILQILPEGFVVETEIMLQDDGRPPEFAVVYNAATGAAVTGKLPFGVAPSDLAGPLGVSGVVGDARASLVDHQRAEAAFAALSALRPWLQQFDLATLNVSATGLKLSASAVPGTDLSLVKDALTSAFDDGAVEIEMTNELPPENTTRLNAATGQREQVVSGFWLPVVQFDPTITACSDLTSAALAQSRIRFLSGSSRLGPQAVMAINGLAAIMRPCILSAGLSAELGGHTDSSGDLSANMQLSLERAEAVRSALAQRGIPLGSMSAAGYGASRPISDNTTEEGRAQNRRTTIIWQMGR
ncbi:MAG: OmpA family protein [Rhodobacteraceae bacterium]|nr:OmpA family protein [Paracoccaceae bacterium]